MIKGYAPGQGSGLPVGDIRRRTGHEAGSAFLLFLSVEHLKEQKAEPRRSMRCLHQEGVRHVCSMVPRRDTRYESACNRDCAVLCNTPYCWHSVTSAHILTCGNYYYGQLNEDFPKRVRRGFDRGCACCDAGYSATHAVASTAGDVRSTVSGIGVPESLRDGDALSCC